MGTKESESPIDDGAKNVKPAATAMGGKLGLLACKVTRLAAGAVNAVREKGEARMHRIQEAADSATHLVDEIATKAVHAAQEKAQKLVYSAKEIGNKAAHHGHELATQVGDRVSANARHPKGE